MEPDLFMNKDSHQPLEDKIRDVIEGKNKFTKFICEFDGEIIVHYCDYPEYEVLHHCKVGGEAFYLDHICNKCDGCGEELSSEVKTFLRILSL